MLSANDLNFELLPFSIPRNYLLGLGLIAVPLVYGCSKKRMYYSRYSSFSPSRLLLRLFRRTTAFFLLTGASIIVSPVILLLNIKCIKLEVFYVYIQVSLYIYITFYCVFVYLFGLRKKFYLKIRFAKGDRFRALPFSIFMLLFSPVVFFHAYMLIDSKYIKIFYKDGFEIVFSYLLANLYFSALVVCVLGFRSYRMRGDGNGYI